MEFIFNYVLRYEKKLKINKNPILKIKNKKLNKIYYYYFIIYYLFNLNVIDH